MKTRRATLTTLALMPLLHATELVWDGAPATAGVQQGGGTWNATNNNWWNGTANVSWNNNTPDTAVFDTGSALTANVTVTLGEAVTTAGLSFNPRHNNNSFIITGSPTLTLAGTPDIGVVNENGTGGTIRIESPLAGTFNKTGNGRLVISNNNPGLSGTISVKGDRLQIGNNSSSGGIGTAAVALDAANAQLVFRRTGAFTLTNAVGGNGRVVLQLNSTTAATLNPASPWSYSGSTTLEPTGTNVTGGKVILGDHNRLPSSTALVMNRSENSLVTLDLNGFNQQAASLASGAGVTTAHAVITNTSATAATLTLDGPANTTYAGLLSGNLSLVKQGGGTQTLSGAHTYTGTTTVSAGTLFINGSLGSGSTTVGANATIGGTGTIGGNLDFDGDALFHVTNLTSPLAVNGTVTFGAGFGIDNLTGIDWDSLAPGTGHTVLSTSQLFTSADIGNFGPGQAAPVGNGRFAYFSNGSLQVMVVPEPSTALLGCLGISLCFRRRRSSPAGLR
jgi:autotransporter-associated beta strand protein